MLYAGGAVVRHKLRQEMLHAAAVSARESDGAENLVVMNGKPGYLGSSNVYLRYLNDGWISLSGDNTEDSNGWKLVAEFELEPGSYTFTGLKGAAADTIALQLHISDDTGFYRYIYQWDEDVRFTIGQSTMAVLHVRVYPNTEDIRMTARPAVYRDE